MPSTWCRAFAVESMKSVQQVGDRVSERAMNTCRSSGSHTESVWKRTLMLQKTRPALPIRTLAGLTFLFLVSNGAAHARQAEANRGLAAVDQAAKAKQHLFIFFYRQDDAQTQALKAAFDSAAAATGGRADSLAIFITDPSKEGIVKRFGLSEAPMPLVLVLASNGAVSASFPSNFNKDQSLEVSKGQQTRIT
jgi:hypothetical protein